MPRTFEELVAEEIDGLYQGALFLTGGAENAAEELLIDTVSGAFHRFPEREHSARTVGAWLEVQLAQRFLASKGPTSPREAARAPRPGPPPLHRVGQLEAGDFHRAAASVPGMARVVLWLVLLRRWSYGDTAEVLGVSRDELQDLLAYRHTFVAAALRVGRKTGTNDTR